MSERNANAAVSFPGRCSARFEHVLNGWATPIVLGIAYALAAAMLVVVELAEPPPQAGFIGIVSNKVASTGARNGLALFRRHLGWLQYPIPGDVLTPHDYICGLRTALISMGVLQALALFAAIRQRAGAPWRWLVGPAISSFILLGYPPVCTDVFSYASFGWASNQGSNPYLVAPAKLRGDPFASMNDWTKITTPYGPVWTGLSRIVTAVSFNQPFPTVMLFKLTAAGAALGLGILAYLGARRLGSERRYATGALVVVAWSPIVLLESAGMAHNDGLMMLFAIAGLLVAASSRRGAVRGGLLLIAVGVLIKPVAIPLLGLTALMRLRETDRRLLKLLREWALDALAIGALSVTAFLPYWSGGRLPGALWELERQLYLDRALRTNQLWMWAAPKLAIRIGGGTWGAWVNTRAVTVSRDITVMLVLVALIVTLWPGRHRTSSLEGAPSRLQRQTFAWLAVTAAVGLFPINVHTWYTIWVIVPLAMAWALTAKSRWRAWIVPVLTMLFLTFLVYHTWPIVIRHTSTASVMSEPVSDVPLVQTHLGALPGWDSQRR